MMSDLSSLKARVLQAHVRGYKIAWAESYVEDLGGKAPPDGVVPNSTEHLLHLIALAEATEAAPAMQEAPKLQVVPEPVAESVEIEQAEPALAEPSAIEAAPVVDAAPAAEEAPAAAPVETKKSKKWKK